jgi:glycosyl transferase family 25
MPESKFGFIDHVVYINLDERTDRRAEVEAELAMYFPPEKVTRFSAIKNDFGALGCTLSHIAAIEMAQANKWGNVLVVEDDLKWNSEFDESYTTLERVVKNDYDAIVLATTSAQWYLSSLKLIVSRTASCYLVHSGYYDTLLSNFRESRDLLEVSHDKGNHAVDMYWMRIQTRDNWFIVIPSISHQRPGYSDIEQRMIDYT